MRKFFSLSLSFLLAFGVVLLPGNKVYSADCEKVEELFSSTYDVTFLFQDGGDAVVSQKISIKNLSSECFVSEFNLTVNSGEVQDVSGSDSLGVIKTSLRKDKEASFISAKLNDEVIGVGKSVAFTIDYKLKGLANKEGNIWKIVAPNIVTKESVTDYKMKLVVPKSFGSVFSVSSQPKERADTKEATVLQFDKEILENQGVSIVFGDNQQISFKFKIPLENRSFFRKKFQIPLPSDTSTQKVFLKSMKPRPQKIYLDSYGNYIAQYVVPARSFFEVQIDGDLKIFTSKALSEGKFSQPDLELYKQGSAYVQVQEGLMQETAKNLLETRKIYNYVRESFTFDNDYQSKNTKNRLGALSLLNSKDAKLTAVDFVDLFTALNRAAGVPTRQVVGVVVSKNTANRPIYFGQPLFTDKLHVWAQVYDSKEKIWYDVDPTWANTSHTDYFGTTFTDRMALLFTDSTYGLETLKSFTALSDGIWVAYSTVTDDFTPQINLDFNLDQPIAGLPSDLEIRLNNSKGVSLNQGKLYIDLENLNLFGGESEQIVTLLPYEEKILKFKVTGGGLWGQSSGRAKITLKTDQTELVKEKNVKVDSLFSFGTQQILLFVILFLLIVGNLASKYPRKR